MWKSKEEFLGYLRQTEVFREDFSNQLNNAWQKPLVSFSAGMSLDQAKTKLNSELGNLANVMAVWYWQLGSQGIVKMEAFLNHLRTCDDSTRTKILTESLGFSQKTAENINAIRANYPEVDLLAPLQHLSSDDKWREAKTMLQQREVEALQAQQPTATTTPAKKPADATSGVKPTVPQNNKGSSTTDNSASANENQVSTTKPIASATTNHTTDNVREEAEKLAANGPKYDSDEQKKGGLAGAFGEGGVNGFLGQALDWIRAPNGAPVLSLFTMLFTAIMSVFSFVKSDKQAKVAETFGVSFIKQIKDDISDALNKKATSLGLDMSKGHMLTPQTSEMVTTKVKELTDYVYDYIEKERGGKQEIDNTTMTRILDHLKEELPKKIKESFSGLDKNSFVQFDLNKDGKTAYITTNGLNSIIYLGEVPDGAYVTPASNYKGVVIPLSLQVVEPKDEQASPIKGG